MASTVFAIVAAKSAPRINGVVPRGQASENAIPVHATKVAQEHVKKFTISACIRREVWESEGVLGGTARSLANRSVAGHFFCADDSPDEFLRPASDGVALFPQFFSQIFLHLHCRIERHRIQMHEQVREKANAIFADGPR